MAELRKKRDGYGGAVDAGCQQKTCGMAEIDKWVVRTTADLENINRERIPTLGRIIAPIT